MKSLKITLIVIVVASICAGIFYWSNIVSPPPPPPPPQNQFTLKIEQEIEQLKAKPDSKFCKDFYKEVAFHINEFYKINRFGNNQSENDQWKEYLEKNLYSAYTEKFINQAIIVFRGSEWKPEDLDFIKTEINELKKSKLLVAESDVDKGLTTLLIALNKYNEIVSFINSCRDFTYSSTALSDKFPIDDVISKIYRAASLSEANLENVYVDNCIRLHDNLNKISNFLFQAHITYLDNKINYWSGLYRNYNSQKDYSNNLYKPIKAEIESLDNGIYNVSNFDSEYNRLDQKWSADNTKAYNYKY